MRPEADPALVRPAEEEPFGPYGELVPAAGHEAVAGAEDLPAAGAGDAPYNMDVEDEGVESAQLFGLMAATVVTVAAIALGLYYLFYLPKLQATELDAENVPGERYVELRELRADADDRLERYAANGDDGTYRMPIGAAMQDVVQRYGESNMGTSETAEPIAVDRADFNLWLQLKTAPAVASHNDPGTILPAPQTLPSVEASLAEPASESLDSSQGLDSGPDESVQQEP